MDRESINIYLPKKTNWLVWVLAITTILFLWLWINKDTKQIDTKPFEQVIKQRELTIDSIQGISLKLQAEIDSLKNIAYEPDEDNQIIYLADTTLDGKLKFFTEYYRGRRH